MKKPDYGISFDSLPIHARLEVLRGHVEINADDFAQLDLKTLPYRVFIFKGVRFCRGLMLIPSARNLKVHFFPPAIIGASESVRNLYGKALYLATHELREKGPKLRYNGREFFVHFTLSRKRSGQEITDAIRASVTSVYNTATTIIHTLAGLVMSQAGLPPE